MHGGDAIEVYSAGSRPSGRLNSKAIDAMRELGYDLSQHSSKSLDDIPDIQYDFVATMGCGDTCPFVRAKRNEDWNIPAFGTMQLGQITTVDVTRFFSKVQGKVAPKYALNLYALLNTMFDVAVQHDLIETSPVRRKLHRPQ